MKKVSFFVIIMSLLMVFLVGCNKSSNNTYKVSGDIATSISTNVKGNKIDLYLGVKGKDKYQINATVTPSNADKSLIYKVTSGNENITVSNTGLVTAKKAGVAYIRIESKGNPNVYSQLTVNISDSNIIGGGIADIGSDIIWEDLPKNPIVSSETEFNEELEKPQTPITKDNLIALIGHYRIAYMTVAGPNGQPVIIDNVVGSGENMRGEFAVNVEACSIDDTPLCVAGLAIKMQLKSQFHHSLITQGIPESIRYIRKDIYSYLQTVDISKIGDEFARIGAVINDDGTVTFTLNNTQVPIPKSYTMTIKLIKIADDALASSNIKLDNEKYFSDGGISYVNSVKILNKDIVIEVDKTEKINYQLSPIDATNKNVTFTPDDSEIVKVDDTGVVTGLKTGKAIITIETEDGKKTDTATVNVVPKTIPVTEISGTALNYGANTKDFNFRLNVGQPNPDKSRVITYVIKPSNATNRNVIIENSDPSSVQTTMYSGNRLQITAIKPTTETVEIVVSSESNKDVKSTIKVNVVDNTVHVNDVFFQEIEKHVKVGDAPFTYVATVKPDNAYNKKVTYSSNNPSVAEVDANSGKVTIVGNGETIISAQSVDNGITGTYKLVVSKQYVDVESISIVPSSLEISDKSVPTTLSVIYYPQDAMDKSVTFKADTDEFITLDENTGLITPKKIGGPTTITATTPKGITTTSTIIVSQSVEEVSSVTITNKNEVQKDIEKYHSVNLTYAVLPDNATVKDVVFEVKDDSDVLEVTQDGLVKGKKSGTATVIVKSAANNNIKDEVTFTVWEQTDISGTYKIQALNLTLNGQQILSKNISTRYHDDKVSFTMSTSIENGLIVKAKYQLAWGHFVNNPAWDVFRYNYLNYNASLTKREMSKDKYAEKNIILNDDGTISYVFPFDFNGNELRYNPSSKNKVEFVLSSVGKTAYNKSADNNRLLAVTPVDFRDPYSFNGTYELKDFVNHVSAPFGVTTGSISTKSYNGKSYGGIEQFQGEFTISIGSSSNSNRPVSMRTKLQLQSSTLQSVGSNYMGQCVSCGQFSYIDFMGSTLSPNAQNFGDTGAENKAKVYVENGQLKVHQSFYRSASIGGADVNVYTFFNKTSDVWKDLSSNRNKCYFATYNGSAANARSLPTNPCIP